MISAVERTIPNVIPSTMPIKRVVQNVIVSNKASSFFVFQRLRASLKSNKLKTAVIIIAAKTASGRW